MSMCVNVNNLPANVNRYSWIVARPVDDTLWFYGAWRAEQKAEADEQARQIGGIVVKVEE